MMSHLFGTFDCTSGNHFSEKSGNKLRDKSFNKPRTVIRVQIEPQRGRTVQQGLGEKYNDKLDKLGNQLGDKPNEELGEKTGNKSDEKLIDKPESDDKLVQCTTTS